MRALCLAVLTGCTSGVYQVTPPAQGPDTESPTLHEDAVPSTAPADTDLTIEVHERDNIDGVNGVIVSVLWYKVDGDADWTQLAMQHPGSDDVWVSIITGDNVQPPGLSYYVHAEDEARNVACDPVGCDASAYAVTVASP